MMPAPQEVTDVIERVVGSQPATILIIEDDPVTRQQFADVLKAENYAAVAFADGSAAIAQLAAVRPSAIFLDLHLPGAGGVECLKAIRATPGYGDVPVVVITGDYFMDDSVSKLLAGLGARIHFKPVWADELAELARELVGGT
jgi:CheY-like chemotaxis protein